MSFLSFRFHIHSRYHVFEASQHCSSNDAQEESHDVQDSRRPQQMVEVHHVLAAPHIRVLVVASDHFHSASPVGGTERETAYSQATNVTDKAAEYLYAGHSEVQKMIYADVCECQRWMVVVQTEAHEGHG